MGLDIPFVFHWKLFSFCGYFSIPTIAEDTHQEETKKETGYRACDPSPPFQYSLFWDFKLEYHFDMSVNCCINCPVSHRVKNQGFSKPQSCCG